MSPPLVTTTLTEVRRLFSRSPVGSLYMRGRFLDYHASLGSVLSHQKASGIRLQKLSEALSHIVWDLWNLGTLLQRLEMTDRQGADGSLNEGLWRMYCGLDIEHFHVELRSLFDYAATSISLVADRTGGVPPDSLNSILKWLDKNPGNRKRLGEDLTQLAKSVPRFVDIRKVRDDIVHRGGYTLVFGKPGSGLFFQVNQGFKPLINPGLWASDGQVVDFRRYASLIFAETLLFIERLGDILWKREPVAKIGNGDSRLIGLGWDVFLDWLNLWPLIDGESVKPHVGQ